MTISEIYSQKKGIAIDECSSLLLDRKGEIFQLKSTMDHWNACYTGWAQSKTHIQSGYFRLDSKSTADHPIIRIVDVGTTYAHNLGQEEYIETIAVTCGTFSGHSWEEIISMTGDTILEEEIPPLYSLLLSMDISFGPYHISQYTEKNFHIRIQKTQIEELMNVYKNIREESPAGIASIIEDMTAACSDYPKDAITFVACKMSDYSPDEIHHKMNDHTWMDVLWVKANLNLSKRK